MSVLQNAFVTQTVISLKKISIKDFCFVLLFFLIGIRKGNIALKETQCLFILYAYVRVFVNLLATLFKIIV